MNRIKSILAWAARNERHLGAILFVFGFATDLLTFTLLSVSVVNLLFIGYLTLSAVCTFGAHLFTSRVRGETILHKTFRVLFPLGAQYAIGSLLSGYLIFYTKSSVLSVSWLFILMLALVFLGNEIFRKHKEHLAFQTVLFFFAVYAYLIFEVPLLLHRIDTWSFPISTGVSVALFALFLLILGFVGWKRLQESLSIIIAASAITVCLIVGAYYSGIVPPIPLTLPESGVYHSLTKENGNYVLKGEAKQPWWHFTPQTVHEAPGDTLYVYSSVFAPVRFSATIVHVWEHYDETEHKWKEEGYISFPISGGRDGGYRGYSEKTDIEPGKWRVSIETPTGLVIGRIRFTVQPVSEEPPLVEEVR